MSGVLTRPLPARLPKLLATAVGKRWDTHIVHDRSGDELAAQFERGRMVAGPEALRVETITIVWGWTYNQPDERDRDERGGWRLDRATHVRIGNPARPVSLRTIGALLATPAAPAVETVTSTGGAL